MSTSLAIFFLFVMIVSGNVSPTLAQTPSWQTGNPTWNGPLPTLIPTPIPTPSPPAPGAAASANLSPPAGKPLINEIPAESMGEGLEDVGFADGTFPLPVADPSLANPTGDASTVVAGEIVDAVANGKSVESMPLQREVIRWYQRPWVWMTKGWTNHAELGVDGSDGNARTLAIQTGLEMKRKTDEYTLALDIDYRQASAQNVITEDNGRLNLDYDRLLGDSSWTLFGKFGMEFDEFKAFDLRLNLNGGLGYYWIRNDRTNLITRLGAGASKEIGAPDDAWKPEAVFGLEADHQLSSRQKLKAKIDYFPAWEDFSDFRFVSDFAWETLLDSTDNLSVRLSVTDRYDSTPQGALANDVYYSALLLYKF